MLVRQPQCLEMVMSIQFGRLNFGGSAANPEWMSRVDKLMTPYGPDGHAAYTEGGFSVLYRAFHITNESRKERQPWVTRGGFVVTWDGRLDNREEIVADLGRHRSINDTDVAIVGAAFDLWGTGCLPKLIGDWALSAWSAHDQTLVLAKDFMGARHLYYRLNQDEILWSTTLDVLILAAEQSLRLDEEYLVGWMIGCPSVRRTPFREIQAVPPSSYLRVRGGKLGVEEYWQFDGSKHIRYASDREYEFHFRRLFSRAVARRLRSITPVLAELSGGIDSSAIVCVADQAIASGEVDAPRPSTVSFYNDSEPHWDERPYFTLVEQKRGLEGFHINVGPEHQVPQSGRYSTFRPTPNARECLTDSDRQFISCFSVGGHRVLIRGIGGDEVLGGVPTPLPELADLLAMGRPLLFFRRLLLWALTQRKPCFFLAWEVVREFLPRPFHRHVSHPTVPAWIRADFLSRYREASASRTQRTHLFGALPCFQDYLKTLEGLRRGLASFPLDTTPLCERRYPYLDRDLLEFLFAIPREQLLRPHQRRSLMRRALVGVVPDPVLNRKRKAFVVRAPVLTLSHALPALAGASEPIMAEQIGMIDMPRMVRAAQNACRGLEGDIPAMIRTIRLEDWLKGLTQSCFVQLSSSSLPVSDV